VSCLTQEESKPSPLTLLAQTCNSIGRDSNSTSTSSSSSSSSAAAAAARKSKSAEDAKTCSLSSPSLEAVGSGQSQTEVDSKAATQTRLTSSPVNVVVSSSSPSVTRSAGTGRTSSPAAVKASTPPPPLLTGDSTSPSRHRGTDGGKTTSADHWSMSASDPDGQYAMQYLAAVAALQRQSAAAVDPAALLPFIAAQRLPVHPLSSHCGAAGGAGDSMSLAGRLKPGSCSDPCCSRCLQAAAAAAAVATSSRGCVVGCSQCGSHPTTSSSSSSSSSSVLPPGGHGAFAAALSALCRLPPDTESSVVGPSSTSTVHTCNWLHHGGAYCGRRFSSVDELMQHLHSHCGTTAEQQPSTVPFPPDIHPVTAGSLFAPLAVLYGASSSYPPLDFLPPPPAAAVQLPSTTVSPPSSLLRHHQHSLAVAAAAAASRYHPYRVPPTLLPPSAASAGAFPSSLAAYYGALCGMTPGSNGTVPVVRL